MAESKSIITSSDSSIESLSTGTPSTSASTCTTTQTTQSQSVPRVVKFNYRNFDVRGGKWSAVCRTCAKTLCDQMGTTTAFTK